MLKIEKWIFKTNQDINGKLYISNDKAVLELSDEDKEIAPESYRKRLLNTAFVWDSNSCMGQQFACTVTSVHVMCTQTALLVRENSYKILITLCKNNLNLSMCSSFFCPVLGCLLLSFILLSYFLPRCTTLNYQSVCFYGSRFCSPIINQASLSQSKVSFPFILPCWREKFHWHIRWVYV